MIAGVPAIVLMALWLGRRAIRAVAPRTRPRRARRRCAAV